MGFSREKHQSGFPCHFPGDLPDTGVVPCLLRLLHRWQILYHSATRWLNSKESACNARDQVQYLCQADPMEKEIALQYSCLGNPMDRGAWQTTVHGAARVRHNLETKQQ